MSAGVSEKGNIDFTKGSIIQNMILFSVPIVLGELFQNFYNSVDALVVGNFVGKYALGAVSVCDTIARLLVGFFTGMSAGVSVVVVREIFLGTLRGYGYARTPMIISLFGMVVLRQLFLAIVMRHPRIEYIYAAFPLGWGPPAAETGKELPLRDGSSFPVL